MSFKNVMLIAGEASGDTLAAELVKALREGISSRQQPIPKFFGAGGPAMVSAGVSISIDMMQHAVIGLGDVLRNYGKFRRIFNDLLALAIKHQPDLIILVDFSGFNRRFAKAIRDYLRSNKLTSWTPKIVQYVSPQVWASRPSRAEKMAKDVDLLLCIFPFEKDWYAKRVPNFRVEFVGHPILDRYASRPPAGAPAQQAHGLELLLLPGSRVGELKRHLPVMLEAAVRIRQRQNVRVKTILPNEQLTACAKKIGANAPDVTFQTGGLAEALTAGTVAIASTGTVLIECAYFGVPTVAMYRTSWSTYQIGKRIVQVKYLSMPNILADTEVFPEFIQDNATAENISREVIDLLGNEPRRQKIKGQLASIITSLGGTGGSKRAAEAILTLASVNPKS